MSEGTMSSSRFLVNLKIKSVSLAIETTSGLQQENTHLL